MNVTIIANGEIVNSQISLLPDTIIIAADGGARHCLKLGLIPEVVIGDFDSLSENELADLENAGSKLICHSSDKDETDLELALDYALQYRPTEITLYGLLGGRWDMTFSNLLLLTSPKFSEINFKIIDGNTKMFVLQGKKSLIVDGKAGDLISAIPLSKEVDGINYKGLKWPLENASLGFGSPRGVSNELISTQAQISIESGILLIIKTTNKSP